METNKVPLELWAGIECTTNRVRDQYFHQLDFNGTAGTLQSLDKFSEIGVKKVRYPALWERISPNGLKNAEWNWLDERLYKLRELGIEPILGLLHHGSGPEHTSLIDDAFPANLADYAAAVADRYPWVNYYTPINEPLTTARFSCLYSHWYPHYSDNFNFLNALTNQCKGIILSMEAIKSINPNAKLIQTEDIGKTFSTPSLTYQADFENDRRLWSLSLLAGEDHVNTLNSSIVLFAYRNKFPIEKLQWFADRENSIDIIGINYYLTSSRFLDENYSSYPDYLLSGNDKHKYADVESLRVRADGIPTHYDIIKEVWDKYQLPMAITEVHVNGSIDEQLTWLSQAWADGIKAKQQGIEFNAVAIWASFGSHFWNNLVRDTQGEYETGLLEWLAAPDKIKEITNNKYVGTAGWWNKPERLIYGKSL